MSLVGVWLEMNDPLKKITIETGREDAMGTHLRITMTDNYTLQAVYNKFTDDILSLERTTDSKADKLRTAHFQSPDLIVSTHGAGNGWWMCRPGTPKERFPKTE